MWSTFGDQLRLPKIGEVPEPRPISLDGPGPVNVSLIPIQGSTVDPSLTRIVDSTAIPVGSNTAVTVLADGLAAGQRLVVVSESLPTVIGELTADSSGFARTDLKLPPSWHPGWHLLYLVDKATGRIVSYGNYFVRTETGCEPSDSRPDSDGDGLADVCDGDTTDGPTADADGDGLQNDADNCPTVANPEQVDMDANGVGDVCEVGSGTGWLTAVPEIRRLRATTAHRDFADIHKSRTLSDGALLGTPTPSSSPPRDAPLQRSRLVLAHFPMG